MSAILSAIIGTITSKLGGLYGYLAKKLLEYGGQAIMDLINKLITDAKQKKALDQVQKDIDAAKPRDEETKKHEKDFLNS